MIVTLCVRKTGRPELQRGDSEYDSSVQQISSIADGITLRKAEVDIYWRAVRGNTECDSVSPFPTAGIFDKHLSLVDNSPSPTHVFTTCPSLPPSVGNPNTGHRIATADCSNC